jgi:GNAT superfamily N-acetyltransferase
MTTVRPLRETDLAEADSIFRLAFGTFLGLPDPNQFAAGHDYINTRFRANPPAAIGVEVDGRFAGSNFAADWGSFGTFGPITVRPEHWNGGVAQAMLGPTMELFDQWGADDAGLFTFPQSPKHIALYQKFGFWPRFLVGVMGKAVTARDGGFMTYSEGAESACRALTDSIFEGLDASLEIRSVAAQGLGETVLVWGGTSLEAFAVCHCGEGTEAGLGNCYVKFAAVQPGQGIDKRFDRLLDAIESMAAQKGLERIEAGVSLERSDAYRHMLRRDFRVERTALAMHRHNRQAFNREDVYVLDDWR